MAAVWNVQLSQAEVVALSKGAHPMAIRPSALRHFWPLHTDGRDLRSGKTLTLTGSPAFVDRMPPVAAPPLQKIWLPPAVPEVSTFVPDIRIVRN